MCCTNRSCRRGIEPITAALRLAQQLQFWCVPDHRKPTTRRHRNAVTQEDQIMTIRTMAVALLLAAFTLVGCNTTAGLGRDIEAAGEEIEETAEETKDRLRD